MKKIFLPLFLLISAFCITGCEKEKFSDPTEPIQFVENISQPFSVEYTEGRLVLTFQAYAKWDVTVDGSATSWLSVSPTSGSKGAHTLTINFTKNEQKEIREGKITVSILKNTYTITIIQTANEDATSPAFEFKDDAKRNVMVGYEAGSMTFAFKANVDKWTASSSEGWLTVTPTSGDKGDYTLTINFAENNKEEIREGKITVSSGDNKFEIFIGQAKKGQVDPDVLPFEFPVDATFEKNVVYTAGSESFAFTSNVEGWTANSSEGWLTVTPTSGNKGDQTLTIHFPKNEQKEAREAKITVSKGDNAFDITIKQEENKDPDFEFSSDNLTKNVAYTAGSESFAFKSNLNGWTASSSEKWLTVTPTSGDKGDYTLTINFSKNEQEEAREGKITVSKESSSFVITVKQEGNIFDVFTQMDDENFKEYCKQFDVNKDGKLSLSEVNGRQKITANKYNIQSLKGIEYFSHLQELECNENKLTSLDLSKNTNLESLECGGNQLKSLDVSGCTNLNSLRCIGNQLTTLDLSKNTKLQWLYCRSNLLTSLAVTNCMNLISLDCSSNQLKALDISKCQLLQGLTCYSNPLGSLDLSNNHALTTLYCGNNSLSSLDIKECRALTTLSCDDNSLSSLDIKECSRLKVLWCEGNQLTSLDISECTQLEELWCSRNQLTSLDVSGCAQLENLQCHENQLSELDVSKNTNLRSLICWFNQLTSLDISKNNYLSSVICYGQRNSAGNPQNICITFKDENQKNSLFPDFSDYDELIDCSSIP